MSRCSVLHVVPSIGKSYGGPTYSLWGYVRAALVVGCDVTVVAPASAADDATEAPHGARLLTFPTRGRAAFILSPALWRWLRAEGGRYDVIHVHGLFNPVSSLSARLCRRRGWPYVMRPFGTLSRFTFTHRRSALKRAYYRLIEAANVAGAGALHFTTDDERANAAALDPCITGHGHVVPPPWVLPQRVREHPGGEMPTVLFIGRLHPVKSVESVLAAWPILLARVPGARLVIAGGGDAHYVEQLRRIASSMNLSSSVRLEGFVEGARKQQLLDEATVFVLPSHHENFGIAVLEAIANGVPVVISPEVQLASFVREHALGIVADRDPVHLAAALAAAIGNAQLQEHCRTHGAGIVGQHFSTASIGVRLLAMYDAARATAYA